MAMRAKKVKFTPEEEEKIIEFVKSKEIFYNETHKQFRDTEARNRLWLELAKDMNKDGIFFLHFFLFICKLMSQQILCIAGAVKKKWKTMRDYFVQKNTRKPTGAAATEIITKRDASMNFLLQTLNSQRT